MNFISKIKGLKLVALLAVMATSLMASAENKVFVKPFSITGYEDVVVPVYMDNDEDVYGVQLRVDLPAELEIVANSAVMDETRLSNGQRLSTTQSGTGFMVTSWQGKPIAGNSGAILTFKVRVKSGMLSTKNVDFDLSNIQLSSKNGAIECPAEFNTKVSLVGDEFDYSFSAPAEVGVAPGSTFPIEVSMTNGAPLGGLQFLMTLPAGFDINATDIRFSERMTPGCMINKTVRPDGTFAFTLLDLATTKIAEPGEGVIFTMYVSVPESFEAYDATVKFFDVIASTVPDQDNHTVAVPCGNFEVKVINGGKYLSDAEAVVEGLRTELAEALAKIAETCPNVAENFTGEDIATAIENIATAAQEASVNGTLHSSYDAIVTQPAAAAKAAIAKLVEDAQAAQAEWENNRVAANEAAYKAAMEAIEGLQSQLDAMKAKVAETYPGFDVTTEITAAQDAINSSKEAAEAEKTNVATEGNYNYTPDTQAIEALITAIEATAKAAADKAEADRVAANEAAYQASLKELEALQAALNEMINKVGETYPGIDVSNEINAAQNAINEGNAQAGAAFEAVAEAGTYEYTVDSEGINALITAIETAAKVATDDAEAKRVADNKAAYEACMEELATLQAKLDEMKSKVAETYPGFDVTAEITAAQTAIDNEKAAVEAEKDRVAAEGNFSYEVDKDNIESLIVAIEAAAKAAADKAEADRVAANEAAYQAALKAIEALQAKLDNMKTLVGVTYPKVDVSKEIIAAQEAIDKAKADADAALEAVAKEGYFDYTVDSKSIEELIDAIRKAAVDGQAAIDAEAARVAANQAAYQDVLSEIAALQSKLDNMKTLVAVSYPGAEVTDEVKAAQDAIDKAKEDALAALEAVAEEGTFEYTVDKAGIEALIDEILEAAKKSGIYEIEIEVEEGVQYFNLQGARVLHPAKGMLLIRVTNDGKREKVII